MISLQVMDVRVQPGDSGFLIDDGTTSVLYDTGFGFTGYAMADKIQQVLGDRPLDYIFLTHSHYDHALGAPYILKRYPTAKVVAGVYAKTIFDKPSAKDKMRDLDRKFAHTCGIDEYDDLADELRVDIAVNDGDEIRCGAMTFTAVDLPGHTKCSVGFYLRENKLLLATETLGVYFGNNAYLPSYLVGYEMTLRSFAKAKRLDIENVLIPHYGLVGGREAATYLHDSERASVATADRITEIFQNGGTFDDAMAYFTDAIYKEHVRPTYPIDAFRLNTTILINLIRKERVGE